ncbi:helix-turn-helix domain-containing protein [Cedecea sp. S5-13]|uniref:helix-turn-helix domain-containing protein n=1 Tax=Cedecea selenatireducens TaxID=3144416 RepID=UPI0035CCFE73
MNENWHSADIIAGLRKKGTSPAAVSRAAGLASSTLANALTRPWPKGEFLIAGAPGVHPREIWPERFATQGDSRQPREALAQTCGPGVKDGATESH